jgi:hypothetical protein
VALGHAHPSAIFGYDEHTGGISQPVPRKSLLTKDPETIAQTLASKKVSAPRGPDSGMRMLTFFMHRGNLGVPQGQIAGKRCSSKVA